MTELYHFKIFLLARGSIGQSRIAIKERKKLAGQNKTKVLLVLEKRVVLNAVHCEILLNMKYYDTFQQRLFRDKEHNALKSIFASIKFQPAPVAQWTSVLDF